MSDLRYPKAQVFGRRLVPASCDYRLGIDIWMGEKSFSVAADDIIFGVNSEAGKFTSIYSSKYRIWRRIASLLRRIYSSFGLLRYSSYI